MSMEHQAMTTAALTVALSKSDAAFLQKLLLDQSQQQQQQQLYRIEVRLLSISVLQTHCTRAAHHIPCNLSMFEGEICLLIEDSGQLIAACRSPADLDLARRWSCE